MGYIAMKGAHVSSHRISETLYDQLSRHDWTEHKSRRSVGVDELSESVRVPDLTAEKREIIDTHPPGSPTLARQRNHKVGIVKR